MTAPAPIGFPRTSERFRILAATAHVLARDGYEGTTLAAIAEAAGVPPMTVLDDVGDRHACAHQALLAAIHQVHAAASAAYHAQDTWPESVREALRALLDFLAAEPDFVKACTIELRHHDPFVDRCLDAGREAFTAFLTPGHDADHTIPLVTAELISGGILHLITAHAAADTVHLLPNELAALTVLVLSSYLPIEEVREVAAV